MLVSSLANCSLSLCTLSLTESPPITHPNLPFLFLAAQSEVLPLFRFLVLTFVFLVESKLPVFIYDFLHSLTFYVKHSDEFIALIQRSCTHNAFISDLWGGGGVMDLVYGSSFLPLHGLSCVFSDE